MPCSMDEGTRYFKSDQYINLITLSVDRQHGVILNKNNDDEVCVIMVMIVRSDRVVHRSKHGSD